MTRKLLMTDISAETATAAIDVLIVGAGPTGLMLANQLARWGVKALIIDRHSGPAQQTRAMAVQARTMEIYAKMGLIDEALARGAVAGAANLWANGRWTARIPLGDIGRDLSPYPYVLMLGQDENERMLGAELARHGVAILWNTELIALDQSPDQVEATLKQPDGTLRKIKAKWVAGCDGSRSPVREMCGIGFPGAPYAQTFFVADTEATGSMKAGELNIYLWKDGFHLFFPMKGKDRWRVIGIVPRHLRERDDLAFDELVPAIQGEAGSDLTFKRCDWFSTYQIQHRAAERFRNRRCFLLGDAAHIHSPAGGQGMNTGLQDAYNLGWKLALVALGQTAPALLDSYEKERIPVAKRLLETTDRAFQVVVSEGFVASLLRTKFIARVAAGAMRFEAVRRIAFRTISQIGIAYLQSPLSHSLARPATRAPLPGQRFPWLKLRIGADGAVKDLYREMDDTSFQLLLFGQPQAGQGLTSGGLVKVHDIPLHAENKAALAHVGLGESCFYLLRPDGYVGLCGNAFDAAALARYLAEQAHLKASLRREEAA
jgi:2-polyprenyl-6-methoxyphenol hydroxylase-like FAD-dependent oxidoreductase